MGVSTDLKVGGPTLVKGASQNNSFGTSHILYVPPRTFDPPLFGVVKLGVMQIFTDLTRSDLLMNFRILHVYALTYAGIMCTICLLLI